MAKTDEDDPEAIELSPYHCKCNYNDFQMLTVLGEGAFGKVLLVKKKDTGTMYAMKMISKVTVLRKVGMEQAVLEREILELANASPFVVSLHYAFQTEKKLFMIMDYAGGGTLKQLLNQRERFSESVACHYCAEVLLALEYLHQKGVLYRDLKPENILLSGDGRVMLSDFGLSKTGMHMNALTTTFCGTPEYAAPEMISRQGYGFAIDFWAVGILLYEMLTGRPPWNHDDMSQLFTMINDGKVEWPPEVTILAKQLIKGFLEPDVTRRLGSNGMDEIKRNRFFAPIHWQKLAEGKIAPPWKPQSLSDLVSKDRESTKETDVQMYTEGYRAVPKYEFTHTESPRPKEDNKGQEAMDERSQSMRALGVLFENDHMASEVLADGSVSYDSPLWCKELGISDPVERIGLSFSEAFFPDDRDAVSDCINDMITKKSCKELGRVRVKCVVDRDSVYKPFLARVRAGRVNAKSGELESVFILFDSPGSSQDYVGLTEKLLDDCFNKKNLWDLEDYIHTKSLITLNDNCLSQAEDVALLGGIKAATKIVRRITDAFAGIKVEIKDTICEEKNVIQVVELSGKFKDELVIGTNTFPPSGEDITISASLQFKFTEAPVRISTIDAHCCLSFLMASGGATGAASPAKLKKEASLRNLSVDDGLRSEALKTQGAAFLEYFTSGDPDSEDKWESFVAEEVVVNDTFYNSVLEGVSGLQTLVGVYRKAFTGLTRTVEHGSVRGNRVILQWVAKGVHSSALQSIKASNKKFEVAGRTVMHMEHDGTITDVFNTWDVPALMSAISEKKEAKKKKG